jgi:hypothetical protein
MLNKMINLLFIYIYINKYRLIFDIKIDPPFHLLVDYNKKKILNSNYCYKKRDVFTLGYNKYKYQLQHR